jgi:hypothetical protein
MHICTCFQTGIRIGLRYGRSDLGTFNVYDEMDEIASFPSIFLLHGHGVFQKEEARLTHIYKSFLSFFMMSSILFNLFVHLRARCPHPTHLHRPCISDPESPKATSIYPLPCAIAQFFPLHAPFTIYNGVVCRGTISHHSGCRPNFSSRPEGHLWTRKTPNLAWSPKTYR